MIIYLHNKLNRFARKQSIFPGLKCIILHFKHIKYIL